jgi:mannan endo-1,4-beta-mannosidase
VKPGVVPAAAPTGSTGSSGADPPGTIGLSGGALTLNGQPYRFTGVNAYEIATDWGTNAGCGGELTDDQLNALFASLRPNSLVRFWAFEGTMAINVTTHQLDWGPIDRVFAAAAAHDQRLIVTLTDQGGTCDGGQWQDPAWYNGGFMSVDNDSTGLEPLSYWTYVQDIVSRYRDSPALGMWEPISEAEASTCPPAYQPDNCSGHQTCPDETSAAQALRHFFDIVGGEIHSLDPTHLVESGLLGGGQCGTSGSDYEYVSASPGIDVLSYHDYYPGSDPIGGDQWNGLAVRFSQAAALGKPIIAGEVGITAGSGSGCLSETQRAVDVQQKLQEQMASGSSGVLLWDWVPTLTQPCSYDIGPGDPVLGVLATASL